MCRFDAPSAMQLSPAFRLGHGARLQRGNGSERRMTTRPVLQRALWNETTRRTGKGTDLTRRVVPRPSDLGEHFAAFSVGGVVVDVASTPMLAGCHALSRDTKPNNLASSTQYNIAEASAERRLVIGLVCFGTLVAGAFLGCGLWMLGVSVAWSATIGAIHAFILLFYGMTELW